MLKPTKYTDINSSLLVITYELLRIFKRRNLVSYPELLNHVLKARGENMRKLFLPALTFLYLLGRIEYHQREDVVEFKDEN